ncbi:putative bifunctional diguanylate cyclase/phosphodiesterase [Methylobacterium iners]|uniref:Diguanylate cyclase n=1 Tax=Methylobacterium iners TaxID=418707 RepID=A0ABQ4RSC9_9HYPH|nr:EAL domain-containing protein [Methylobacterium iners]GJD93624.1 hypothetical protein OCOJLMKI_0820 [Methylobacterium iners]
MTEGPIRKGKSFSQLLSRQVWPMAALCLLTFGWVGATLMWTSDSTNRTAAEREVEQLAAAMEQGLIGMRLRLAGATAPGPALDLLLNDPVIANAERPLGFLEFTGLFIFALPLGPDNDEIPLAIREREPLLGAVVAKLRTSLAVNDGAGQVSVEERATQGVSRLIYDGGVYAITAVPLPPQADGRRLVAIACKHFTEGDLRKVAELHGIKNLRLGELPAEAGHMSLPLFDGQGRTVAYITWQPSRPGDLIRARLLPSTLVGSLLALGLVVLILVCMRWVARDLARHEAQMHAILNQDPLSGLPNRRLFGERLDNELGRIAQGSGSVAVLLLDLDRFKEINDTFGHGAGDAVIKQVAERISVLLQEGDTLARLGGDEFAILLSAHPSHSDAENLARRILAAVKQPFVVNETNMSVGISVGIVLAPIHGSGRETLMRRADASLYKAKANGRNDYCFFESEIDQTIQMRKLVEDELRGAIEGDGLELAYQPIVSADGSKVLAVEALVRWRHPVRGLIGPGEFIPIAEERGLIIPLGESVLRRACTTGARWKDLTIAVNLSALHVLQADFVEVVARILEEAGLDPKRLEIELTESVLVEDPVTAERAINRLRDLGVRFALDDFGTGYSSLLYLRRFAFDTIKIDRTFVQDIDASEHASILLTSIVSLGRTLGRTVTAEGVETSEQQKLLQLMGCTQLQGYLFSKPVSPNEIDGMLRTDVLNAAA